MTTDYSRTVAFDPAEVPLQGLDVLRAAMAGFAPDEVVILIDGRHMGYRAHYTRQTLQALDGTPTGMAYGMMQIIMCLCRAANTGRYLVLWDGGIDYRRKVFADYKKRHDRARTDEEAIEDQRRAAAFKVTRQVLDKLNAPQIQFEEGEADDLAGAMAGLLVNLAQSWPQGMGTKPKCVLLVSDDKDWLQLLYDGQGVRVAMWRGAAKQLVTEEAFIFDKGFKPHQHAHWKALVGEPVTGDNIPGVPGIGDKTADKLIGAFGTLEGVIAAAERAVSAGKPKKADQNIAQHAANARVSLKLCQLARTPAEFARAIERNPEALSPVWKKALADSIIPHHRLTPPALNDAGNHLTGLGIQSVSVNEWIAATSPRAVVGTLVDTYA